MSPLMAHLTRRMISEVSLSDSDRSRTSLYLAGVSFPDSCSAARLLSFDHLAGASQQGLGNVQIKCFRSFGVCKLGDQFSTKLLRLGYPERRKSK